MAQEMAEARGRATIRPWRVGVLVDTASAAAVREAIAKLSRVWGGLYMPIFDISTPIEKLETLGGQYDVDSLYADVVEGQLGDLLREPGWLWGGRGPWGPFGEEHGFRKGLLPTRAFLDGATDLVQPTWECDDPADLVFAATWGVPEEQALPQSSAAGDAGSHSAPYRQVLATTRPTKSVLGMLQASTLHVGPQPRAYLDAHCGVYVIRPDHPTDVVEFWNMRSYGTKIIGVPAEDSDAFLTFLLAAPLPGHEIRGVGGNGAATQAIHVWGFEDASDKVAEEIRRAAERDGLVVRPTAREDWSRFIFQGLRTRFTRSIRADFRPEARSIDVPLPGLPIGDEPDSYARGVVAAEVKLHSVWGQDPRLTTHVPPYRRHSSLVQHASALDGIEHVRVTSSGVALGVDARQDQARIPFAYNQDVMRLLFGAESVSTAQSDIGKFQSRAAEKFGGPFSGVFNQPGVRSAVALTAGKNSGVTLPHLRQVVERDRGGWPDPVFARKTEPKEYASREVNGLLHSGLFVPTFKIHCSHCRVESHVSADELGTVMTCEFCGKTFNLALSHSLTAPGWRYRLAAHLRADQVQALLPALAAASFLSQLRHVEEPALPHVLGLEVTIEGRTVEVDVAVYLPDPEWAVVLGEVKTSNRIDENDIANLEFLQGKLSESDVRSLLLFATLKDRLSPEEVANLRQLVERSRPLQHARGMLIPNVPLVLTGPDLSHPPVSRDHPWRWKDQNYTGAFGTALTSCERNLGLRNFDFRQSQSGWTIDCEWDD